MFSAAQKSIEHNLKMAILLLGQIFFFLNINIGKKEPTAIKIYQNHYVILEKVWDNLSEKLRLNPKSHDILKNEDKNVFNIQEKIHKTISFL